MNRETEIHFSGVPQVHKPRSKMVIPHDLLTSWDAGQCVPIFVDPDILPGDSIKMNMACVMRMATPLYPIFGNIVADVMFFFVPYRLVWNHWKEFWGENTNAWYQSQQYNIPHLITDDSHKFAEKSLGDYMGIPTELAGISVNALPFRCFCKIWNDWFRSEALQQEIPFSMGDSDEQVYHTTTPGSYTARGGGLPNSNKLRDLFTGALPAPQKGPDVMMPLGTWAPVRTRTTEIDPTQVGGTVWPLHWDSSSTGSPILSGQYYDLGAKGNSNLVGVTEGTPGTEGTNNIGLYPSNLWTDLTNATAASINSIRTAFAIQRFYEAQSNGSRYIEFIRNIFGVTSPDARLQRSEYLGGKRIPINIQTVLKTGSTDQTAPLGQTGAYSHTSDKDEYFTHSFVEHGCLIGILTTRYYHSFNQGIPKGFTRRKWTDFYVPQFATLGNLPIFNEEIYAQGTSQDKEVFGYQEAWANGYRYHPNTVTGAMRTTYTNGSLDPWHLADNYQSLPTLGSSWIQEDKTNIDRTLAVSSAVENQFFGDFYFRPVYTRVMPLYSMPGLLDHF